MNDRFVLALLNPTQPVPDGLNDPGARVVGKRFDVYRNNVIHSLVTALRIGFPAVTRLIGRQTMDQLAGRYARAQPPTDPLMMYYGHGFPEFLAATDRVSHLGYLADIARLELAMRQSYHSADADPISPVHLSEIPTEALMRATLTLAPALRLIRSDWPVYDIWRRNADDRTPKPIRRAQDVLITRPAFDPVPQVLSPGGAVWIRCLAKGACVGAAFDAALRETPRFDMAAPLTLLLLGGALVSLDEKDRP